ELFDGQDQWLRVDPTPGSGRPGEAASESVAEGSGRVGDRTFDAYLDSLRILWYRRIVNFDQRQQRELLSDFRLALREVMEGARQAIVSWVDRLRHLFDRGWTWQRVFAAAPGVLSGIGLILLGAFLWRFVCRRLAVRPVRGSRIRRKAGHWL